MKLTEKTANAALKTEIKLQINQRLYDRRIITKEVYEEAKIRIVAGFTGSEKMTSGYRIKKSETRTVTVHRDTS